MQKQILPAADREVLRSLRRRSLATVSLLAVFGAATLWLFGAQTRELETSATILNLSGRQRMLSQRAGLVAGELDRADDDSARASLRSELSRIADLMASTHADLRVAGAARTASRVRTVYEEPPHQLDRRVETYVRTIRRAAAAGRDEAGGLALRELVVTAREGQILPSLDTAVSAYESYTREHLRRLRLATRLMAALTLAMLLCMGQFVLRPMLRDLRSHMREMRRSELDLAVILENAPVALATFDRSGRLLSANRALSAIFGYGRDELLNMRLGDLVHPDDFRRRQAELERLLAGEIDHLSFEKRFVLEGGGIAVGRLECRSVRISSTEPARLIAHFIDRSEQVRVEKEARRNQERLAHITRLTTIGEMAVGIAHEINQPLTAIATYTQACRRLLRSGDSSEDLGEVLEKVSAQAYRAGEVIQRLRLFIRKRHGRDELIDVNRIVEEAVELARADARFRDVPIRTALAPTLPRVVVDSIQIQQVILNLVRNAIEATVEAGTREPVVVTSRLSDPEFVQVAIRDRGRGLSDSEKGRLFEAFYTTKGAGLGMGLTISRSIVTAYGGHLWCETRNGAGSVFRFTLPVAVGEEALVTAAGAVSGSDSV